MLYVRNDLKLEIPSFFMNSNMNSRTPRINKLTNFLRGLSKWNAPTEAVKTPRGLSLWHHWWSTVYIFYSKMCQGVYVVYEYLIRTCVLEDMNSQCGTFRFEDDTLEGCILTCAYDGCNGAVSPRLNSNIIAAIMISLLLATFVNL